MHRIRIAVLAATLLVLATAGTASAGKPATRGILPPNARVHGHTMVELAEAWSVWLWGTNAEDNAVLAGRCERSPMDPKIWFLPVSLGGETASTCEVPPGSFLLLLPGGVECSNIEPEPFFGEDLADLTACADEFFAGLDSVEVSVDGRSTSKLDDYVFTTGLVNLPADNLLSADPGISLSEGWWVVVRPLSKGTHTLHAATASTSAGFQAGMTYTINVR